MTSNSYSGIADEAKATAESLKQLSQKQNSSLKSFVSELQHELKSQTAK